MTYVSGRRIAVLVLLASCAGGAAFGSARGSDEERGPSYSYSLRPSQVTAEAATTTAADLPPRSRLEAVNGELECNIIDFEGYGDQQPIGKVPGDIEVTFGSTWRASIDHEAGGSGNFANEPSPSTTIFVRDGTPTPINFSKGVQFIEIFYSAAAVSIPLRLTAHDGLNGTGRVIDEAFGEVVGLSLDGAPCEGDPGGQFCLYSTLTLVSETSNIRSITLSGAQANAFGFDDMTFCNTPPVRLEIGPEESFVPAEVRPQAPRVVFGPDGNKAVVWFQLGGGGTVICVQFFDPAGNPITQPLLVNAVPGNNQTPSAAFDRDGNLQIFWSRDETAGKAGGAVAQGSSVLGRKFDPSGQPLGPENEVSTGETGESATPQTETDLAGNAVVVWLDGGKVRGKLLDANGSPKGPAFDVNSDNQAFSPALAVSASGDFVVAWRGTSGGNPAIFVRRYGDEGTPKANGEVVSGAGAPDHPAVAIDQAGNFIVVWDANGPSGRDIFTQRYSAQGQKNGQIRRANANTSGNQTLPQVALNSKGRFVVVWESTEGAPANAATAQDESVLGRVFNPQGEPERVEEEIATAEGGTTPEKPDVSVDDDDDFAVVYERRNGGGQSEGIFRKDVDLQAPAGTCNPDETGLCLNEGRFRVTALWEDPDTREVRSAQAVPLTDDTGFFWFFEPDNVEVVVKALRACPVNSRFWVFAAGLTDVEVTLRVDDVITGQSNTYFNVRGDAYLPILDTDAFPVCDAASTPSPALTEAEVEAIRDEVLAGLLSLASERSREEPTGVVRPAAEASAACATDADSLCVTANRFRVEVDFRTAQGNSGHGQAEQLTADSGTFWFFDPDNVEIVIKVLNACTFNSRFWVFAAGLTNVEVDIRVTDTNTGVTRNYENPLGKAFAPIQDTNAFASCP